MDLHGLLSMRVGVPDPDALAGFYQEIGLTTDAQQRFGGTDPGPAVGLEHYAFRRLLEVEIAATDERAISAASTRLTALGLTVHGNTTRIEVVDPATKVRFSLVASEPRPSQIAPVINAVNSPGQILRRNLRAPGVNEQPRPPRRLGHIVIGSPQMSATRDLLTQGLGFKISDQLDGVIAFLRCSTDHHNVAVVSSPVPMLQHYSWECEDVDHVGHAATGLLRTDPSRHAWGFGRHFVGSNYYWYLRDPSGSFIEFYSDMDVIDDEDAWAAAGGGSFGFEHIANAWGPNMPAEFVVPEDLPMLEQGWSGLS
jgi:hypothetical protein